MAAAAFTGIDPAQARLAVWGDAAADPAYTRELRELGAADLRGAFAEEQKAEVFAQMDALIVPSVGLESFGLVAREAMHYGVPVLASDRGALPERFEGVPECGALFDPEDPASLRAWIERLIREPEILDRWAAALPPVKGMDQHAEEIEEVYDRVLRR